MFLKTKDLFLHKARMKLHTVELQKLSLLCSPLQQAPLALRDGQMLGWTPHQENKKRAVWARYEGIKVAGNIVPETHGLRLQSLYQENSEQV